MKRRLGNLYEWIIQGVGILIVFVGCLVIMLIELPFNLFNRLETHPEDEDTGNTLPNPPTL